MTAVPEESVESQVHMFDAIVIGAGFSGLYMLYRLREAGFSTRVYEAGAQVGGTWYWNRYPGARCDSESIYYNYTFSDTLLQEWTWSQRYPEQPEILRYLNFVADKLHLREDILFNTRVIAAHFDEMSKLWHVHTDDGTDVLAKYLITGVGCLSAANVPDIPGLADFQGEWYHTGRWPHTKVDFVGKRVGVIGTGSSGVQSIPVIAQEAEHLTVFQRTPQYTIPARNHPYTDEFVRNVKANYSEIVRQMRDSRAGMPGVRSDKSVFDDSPEERERLFEAAWEKGGLLTLGSTYNDLVIDEQANRIVADFLRTKIAQRVDDPNVAAKLIPTYYYGTKRQILDTNYYETYNRSNVTLVDVRSTPIQEITPTGVKTTACEYELDALVFATGYDGMTGPLFKIDIRGRNGVSLKEKWKDGAATRTYLGLSTAGFPNMFMITGPESPSVLSNMPVSIEQHVEWIADCMMHLRAHDLHTIEASVDAEEAWSKHCKDVANMTLFPKTASWYTGGNIEGKPHGFPMYLGGVDTYRQICHRVAANGYEGFAIRGC